MSFNKHSTSNWFRQYFVHGAYPSAWQAALPVGSSSDWSRVKARGCTFGFFGFWNNFVWRTWDVENWSVNLGQGIRGTVDWAQKIWKKSTLLLLRSREYRFTHMNCSLLDIPFLSEALSGERIWVILKVPNLMRKVWWFWQEEKEKKLIWRLA